MKTWHVVAIAAGSFAAGWVVNNLAWGGTVTPLFPTVWFPKQGS